MLLPRFEFHRPDSLAQAVAMLAELGQGAKLVAGGTDLLVNMKHGAIKPAHLVSIEGLEELGEMQTSQGRLALGAGFTAARLAASSEVPAALAKGAGSLGSPQVRNRATMGGNLATARPAADICLPLLALGAAAVLLGPSGQRRVPLAELFLGPGQTSMKPNEVVCRVELAAPAPGSGSGFEKLGLRKAMEISLVNVAAFLRLESDGSTIAEASVAMGAVAPTPILSPSAAGVLQGAKASEQTFVAAAAAAAGDARPIDDHRGSAAYRRDMVAVLAAKCLRQALACARGEREAK